MEVAVAKMDKDPIPLSVRAPDVAVEPVFRRYMRKLLARLPDDRFATGAWRCAATSAIAKARPRPSASWSAEGLRDDLVARYLEFFVCTWAWAWAWAFRLAATVFVVDRVPVSQHSNGKPFTTIVAARETRRGPPITPTPDQSCERGAAWIGDDHKMIGRPHAVDGAIEREARRQGLTAIVRVGAADEHVVDARRRLVGTQRVGVRTIERIAGPGRSGRTPAIGQK